MNRSSDGVAHSDFSDRPYEPRTESDQPEPRRHSLTRRLLGRDSSSSPFRSGRKSSSSGYRPPPQLHDDSLTARMHRYGGEQKDSQDISNARVGSTAPRPPAMAAKLGTFAGVFVPTSLNVLSVLMFLRFGFILGQTGVLGMMGMLVASYVVNLVTILSLSAVATNGTVRGGGAYYLISRSLGPEFGGSIGVVFYLAQVFNTGMNAVGLIDCVRQNFGSDSGNWGSWLQEGYWWQYLWGTVVLIVCTIISFGGSGLFARANNGLLFILLISTLSIPFSALVQSSFTIPEQGIVYTGLSWHTFRKNLLPHFTKGAAGSQLKGHENFQDVFGILYPSTAGIFAGASMSGSLKHPSKAIPKGTLTGVAMTFATYTLVILAMGATITRGSFYRNVNVVQDTVLSGTLILAGEVASSLFSTLMGLIGAADLLQALARDALIPGSAPFGKGMGSQEVPIYSLLLTYVLTQITLFGDINQIATLVTMGYLMTFLVMNLACFLLKIGSAPNFRPSFRYFNSFTALFGTLICGTCMFFVDGWAASGCVALLILVFLLIHYTTPPKPWGDVSQSLIYHQVRKYLLRLKTEHVKFWRPQILLFVNDPRRSYKMIQFCNSLKKGGLFVLGHVIVTPDFETNIAEARKQQQKWNKYIDFSRIKAFVQIVVSPGAEWGCRNVVLSAGLGGMRPNIVVMGFYNIAIYNKSRPLVEVSQPQDSNGDNDDNDIGVPIGQELPTDDNRQEPDISPGTYVTILEDLLLGIQINVAIGRNFSSLQLPHHKNRKGKKYIDLWPIQMSAEISAGGESQKNVLTTNFDTYTLILQLGCILNTVPAWKKTYDLRINVFVEYESEVEEERSRVQTLLDNLRIRARVLVFWLASGDTKSYQAIVNGDYSGADASLEAEIDNTLEDEDWWQDMQRLRGKRTEPPSASLSELVSHSGTPPARSMASAQESLAGSNMDGLEGLRRVLLRAERRRSAYQLSNRRSSISLMSSAPVMSITTHRLPEDMIAQHAIHDSASEDDYSGDELSTAETTDVEADDSLTRAPTRSSTMPVANQLNDWQAHFSGIHRERSMPEDDVSPGREFPPSEGPPAPTNHTQSDSALPRLQFLVDEEQKNAEVQSSTSSGRDTLSAPAESGHARSNVPTTTDTTAVAATNTGRVSLSIPKSSDLVVPESAVTSSASSRPTTADSTTASSTPAVKTARRPKMQRHTSGAKFSSKPVPATKIATDDGPGPSIMFTESMERPDPSRPMRSIYERSGPANSRFGSVGFGGNRSSSSGGSGYKGSDDDYSDADQNNDGATYDDDGLSERLSAQSAPLSFNDLPCRAQHLILNELMRANSRETAVLFTTLPSPAPGTGKSDDESIAYLSDLDLLCGGLPPTLLVHSNSMTVTMNL